MNDDLKGKDLLSELNQESEHEEHQASQITLHNVNNMNINIINQIPQQNDDIIQSMKKLNISNNTNKNRSKDLALNYYFGERPSGNTQSLKEDDIFNHNYQQENNNYQNKEFFPLQNKTQTNNYKMVPPQELYNVNSKPFLPKNIQIGNEVDNKLYQMDYTKSGRFFVIKSVDESNIIRSISFNIWCSTIKGNQKLQKAFKEANYKYPIYLFFSVNGSGKFMGLAQMVTEVEYKVNFNYWSQNDKWKGFFFINWLFIKDIPNRIFRTIINEYNDNKPVTSSRDTQEIVPSAGIEMLKIFKDYPSDNSIFDQMSNEDKIMIMQSQQQQMQNQSQGIKRNIGSESGNIMIMKQMQEHQRRIQMNNAQKYNEQIRNNMNPIYGKDPNMGRNIPLMMQQLQKQQMQMQNMNYNIQQKSMYQQQMRPNNQYIQNKEEVIQMKNEIKEGDVNQNFFNSKSSSESDKAFN